jgi:hypothetical protein
MSKKKLTKAERAERETQRAQVRANAQRTRDLAERVSNAQRSLLCSST